jgi:hypothetical protein
MLKRETALAPERLAMQMRARILGQHKGGEKVPSARKLAAEYGVSVSTLRAAQAILMHEGLLTGHPRSGVRVSPSGSQLRVGVLTELNVLSPDIGYYRDLADHTLRELRARSMAATLFCGAVKPGEVSDAITCPEFWDAVACRRLDAAVILDVPCTEAWYWRVQGLALPAAGTFTSFGIEHNAVNIVAPGLTALRRQGAARVAMLTWSRGRIAPVFDQTLAELGMVSHPKWIAGEFNPALPGSGWEAFRDVWTALPEKPDGLLVTDDVLFRDAARAIAELGIAVPERLKVVTHANRSSAHPPAPFPHTRFEFDPAVDARALVDLLERRLKGEAPPAEPIRMPFAVEDVGAPAEERVTAGREARETAGVEG